VLGASPLEMISKQDILSRILDPLLLFDILARLETQQRLIVLAYHRICNRENNFLLDGKVISAVPEDFEKHLKFIKKHFSVIALKELYMYCIHSCQLPRNPVIITFDDGYRDNYHNAFPLLLKYNLKATFFIPTDYIETRDLLWWDKIAYVIKSSKRRNISLVYPCEKEYNIGTEETRSATIRDLQRIVKTTESLNLKTFIDSLSLSAEIDINKQIGNDILLTWSDIKEMKQAGMDIGSHTKSHRVLSTLPENELEKELSGSKSILEHHLGEQVYSLAYPVGGKYTFNQKVQNLVKKCGYTLAFSYGTGKNFLGVIDPLNVKRLATDGISPSYLKAIMTKPSIFKR